METTRKTPEAHVDEVRRFLALAMGLRFESRFFGEDQWWPALTDDVGWGLVSYHADLSACLDKMLEGEVLSSRLAVYRVATTPQVDAAEAESFSFAATSRSLETVEGA